MKTFFATLLFLALVTSASKTSALPIKFVHTGSATGSIGGTDFTAASFTITATGDTDRRVSIVNGYSIDHDSAVIEIEGVGRFPFVGGTRTFVNNGNAFVGFSQAGVALDLLMGPVDPIFASWDMQSSIGPIRGLSSNPQWQTDDVIVDGNIITAENYDSVYFATVVPEPSTWTLLAIGFCMLTLIRRRR